MARRIVTADETDAYSRHRWAHKSLHKAGAVKKIKRATHRRERREGHAETRIQLES